MTGKSQKGAVRRRLQLQSGWLCSSRSRETASTFEQNFDNGVRRIVIQGSLEMTYGAQEVAGLVKRLPFFEVRQCALFRLPGRQVVGVHHLVEDDGLRLALHENPVDAT